MFSSMEVTRPTDVVVDYRRLVRGRCAPLAISVGLQDRIDRAVGSRANLQRPTAGGLHPLADAIVRICVKCPVLTSSQESSAWQALLRACSFQSIAFHFGKR